MDSRKVKEATRKTNSRKTIKRTTIIIKEVIKTKVTGIKETTTVGTIIQTIDAIISKVIRTIRISKTRHKLSSRNRYQISLSPEIMFKRNKKSRYLLHQQ